MILQHKKRLDLKTATYSIDDTFEGSLEEIIQQVQKKYGKDCPSELWTTDNKQIVWQSRAAQNQETGGLFSKNIDVGEEVAFSLGLAEERYD